MNRVMVPLGALIIILALVLSIMIWAGPVAKADSVIYLPIVLKQPVATVYVNNSTGGQLCYTIFGTNIGLKCFPVGIYLYGSFAPGTYSYRAEARCGVREDTLFFGPTTFEHFFQCVTVPAGNALQGTLQARRS